MARRVAKERGKGAITVPIGTERQSSKVTYRPFQVLLQIHFLQLNDNGESVGPPQSGQAVISEIEFGKPISEWTDKVKAGLFRVENPQQGGR